jgi:hypothetical protein
MHAARTHARRCGFSLRRRRKRRLWLAKWGRSRRWRPLWLWSALHSRGGLAQRCTRFCKLVNIHDECALGRRRCSSCGWRGCHRRRRSWHCAMLLLSPFDFAQRRQSASKVSHARHAREASWWRRRRRRWWCCWRRGCSCFLRRAASTLRHRVRARTQRLAWHLLVHRQ